MPAAQKTTLKTHTEKPDICDIEDDDKENKKNEEYSAAFEAFLAATTNDNETPIPDPLTF
jgi:hypothetical protein